MAASRTKAKFYQMAAPLPEIEDGSFHRWGIKQFKVTSNLQLPEHLNLLTLL
jgi:hypothetical protein